MSLGFLTLIQTDQVETTFKEPSYFVPLIIGSLALGAVVWLIAAVMGFARAGLRLFDEVVFFRGGLHAALSFAISTARLWFRLERYSTQPYHSELL